MISAAQLRAAQRPLHNTHAPRPVAPTPNYLFTSGTSALEIPFQLSSNFVFVQLRVNNSRPLWFLFSTASTSVIDTRIAKELGLPVQGKEDLGGIEAGLIPGISLALPGVTALNLTVAPLPLDFLSSIMGRAIAGTIGYDFISRFVIEVDYATRKMNVYAPASYRYSGSGDVIPIKFIDKSFLHLVPELLEIMEAMGRGILETNTHIDIATLAADADDGPDRKPHAYLFHRRQLREWRRGR